MRQIKVAAGGLAVTSCFVTLFLYYWYHSSTPIPRYQVRTKLKQELTTRPIIRITNGPMKHIPLNEMYKDGNEKNNEDSFQSDERKSEYLINTPGCQIPTASIKYEKYVKKRPISCGKRAVFLTKFDEDTIRVTIKPRAMKTYLRRSKNFSCCYRYIKKFTNIGHEKYKLEYTNCRKTQDGDILKLETDFVNIKCFEHDSRNMTHIVYSDVYPFVKKIDLPNENMTKKDKYNVLMMGMDSMSLLRFKDNMPRSANFIFDNVWLAFRGYHKVGANTFPNLMAVFTGLNLSTITERCSGKMDKCNDLLIWNKFKESGYVTAYGEDYLQLPDTFNKKFAFQKPPTDHYLRPFYMHSEVKMHNTLICAGKETSGQQMLDYAVDFATTYRDSPFFGVFWMNSFSHNEHSHPHDADKMLENFFNQLTYSGTLEETFIIFFSDHGIRFGEYRTQLESFYDERMPALVMWIPNKFRGLHYERFQSATVNQFRLLTPYDLYNTLSSINSISNGANFTDDIAEACPKCTNIFENINENRTCTDVGISQRWCGCHKLYPLDIHDTDGMKSVLYVVAQIKDLVAKAKTERCWGCMSLTLKKIIRIHFYYSHLNIFYVVAFSMTPGNLTYEAIVARKGTEMELVGEISIISVYRGLGKCTIPQGDYVRKFCVCQRKENCNRNYVWDRNIN